MNQPVSSDPSKTGTEDILFECPQCGKSLEIDARGAGYMIVCPDCKNEIQVPAWSGDVDEQDSAPSNAERERIRIEETLHQLAQKVARLEKLQQSDDHCFKRLGDEIVLIQSALDRITDIVESRRAEG